LQTFAPISAPVGLNIATPAPLVGIAPAPPNVPGLALTAAQVTTLGSGNATSINQLLGQLVGGNTTNQQLVALVNAIVTPPAPTPVTTLPPVSLPPVSTPPPAPPVVTTGPQPAPTPAPPVVSNPINYVSRS
jgi:hypothetical protein